MLQDVWDPGPYFSNRLHHPNSRRSGGWNNALVFPAEDVEEMMSGISSTWSVAWSPGHHYSMLEPLVRHRLS